MTFTTLNIDDSRPMGNQFMPGKNELRISTSIARIALLSSLVAVATQLCAQAPARLVGTITAVSGTTLTVKPDSGDSRQVAVPSSVPIKRVAPGQKDLSTAETIQFSDLAVGDRVLVKLDPGAPEPTSQALQIIAIKQTDVAAKQQKDREDWQRRGVGGLVKSVDAQSGDIVLSSGIGATAKTVTVHTTKATTLKRYAPASVRFDAAVTAPIDAIHSGDQLRARGTKNADGTAIDAEEVVSGTFRNISGTITSLDAAGSTMVVKDLATKKPVTVHISADAQMRRLPETMARMLAGRLKGGATPAAGSPSSEAASSSSQRPGGQWAGPGSGQGGTGRGAGQGGDPQQMLSRLPAIQLSDLQKGEAVMLVSTFGTTEVTGITLLAGVEPLLEAPAASQNLLNNWSLGSGAPDAAAQ
jgi:hypothetical protein